MKKKSLAQCNKDANKDFSLTIVTKIFPSAEQALLIDDTLNKYIVITNQLINEVKDLEALPKMSSATVSGDIPSCLRGQIVQDVRSIYKKTKKNNTAWPILKRPVAIWNNQNVKINHNRIEFPVNINGKCTRISVKIALQSFIRDALNNCRLGSLRITKRGSDYIAQIAYTPNLHECESSDIVMGIDLGILCPAVAVTSDGHTKFFGNGRERKYKRRHFQKKRRSLQSKKKIKKVKSIGHKEQRWMNDQDHKLSRQLVDYAIAHNVGTIKLEWLNNIRNSTRTSRKNKYNKYFYRNDISIDNWSFYRLTQYIVYKARLAGIKLIFVNPANTSKTCPCCGKLNAINNRNYECECGYKSHRDRVGAYNIMQTN